MNKENGTLKSWRSDKGFGFIKPDAGGKDVFVHVRDFGNLGRAPRIGDRVSYQPIQDKPGRFRAADVHIEGVPRLPAAPARAPRDIPRRTRWSVINVLSTLAVPIAIGAILWTRGPTNFQRPAEPAPVAAKAGPAPPECALKRYCTQMSSCEEARYYLAHCPDTAMDGDHDGIPCEDQWCTK